MNQVSHESVRVAAIWPRPRGHRWRLGRSRPDTEPDQSDGLLFLEQHGFSVVIEDSTPFPWNPFARMHEMWSGLDPLRTVRLISRLRRYEIVIGVGDAVAFFLAYARRVFRLRVRLVLIDPALSPSYERRQRLQDRLLRHVDRIIVFGAAQRDFLVERYGDRIIVDVVPHRIDTDFCRPADASVNRLTDAPYLLSVGEDASRDFRTLAEAIAILQHDSSGQMRCVIKTGRPLEIPGPGIEVNREAIPWVDLRALYQHAAVVVLPLHDSLHAGGINTLLEAMAVGRPVVVTASRGIRDYVTDGVDALVVPPGDPHAIADAVRRLLQDPARASALGARARQRVVDTCSNPVYAARLATILRDVLAPGHRAYRNST